MHAELVLDDEHPLALELTSLRSAVDRFQHEAHAASVKLQRHSLDASQALERAQFLERDNARLREEIALLRSHPDISPHPASLQVQELTLALRRISDKLDLTEETLLVRTTELASALSDLAKAKHDVDGAYELAARTRGREEEGKIRERELEQQARAADEERRMADLVVQEYADLVRSLEGRPSSSVSIAVHGTSISNASSSSTTLVDGLAEGKSGLQKLLEEFNGETERLEADIVRLHGELAASEAMREAGRKGAEYDRIELGRAQVELEKLRVDDKAAAKMVSRYMKFSQSSTDALQKAMDNLKARHKATNATLSSQIEALQNSLLSERRQSEKLRQALDELSEDIARETYGRRREISLRLALLGREEVLAEGLRRWSRKARELFERSASSELGEVQAAFEKIVQEAEELLLTLDGEHAPDYTSPGSLGRIMAAQNTVSSLTSELQSETSKRMELERRMSQLQDSEGTPQTPIAAHIPPPVPSKFPDQAPVLNGTTLVDDLRDDSHPPSPMPLPRLPPRMPTPQIASEHVPESIRDVPAPLHQSVGLQSPSSDIETTTLPVLPQEPDVTDASAPLHEHKSTDDLSSPSPRLTREPEATMETEAVTSIPAIPSALLGLSSSLDASSIAFPAEQDSVEIVAYASNLVPLDVSSQETPLPIPFPTTAHPESQNEPLSSPSLLDVISELADTTPSQTSQKDTLLTELGQVRHRYDDLQRSFRDCRLSLKELKKTLSTILLSTENSIILQAAVERLNDISEDARVELEIRVADEELAVRGFETLLAVPGAISDETEHAEVEREIRSFIDGTQKSVAKATQQLTRKLDDLQHDIASIKRSLHELSIPDTPHPATSKSSPSWSRWTAGLLSNPQQHNSPAPTFGSVMTTPRLRHSPSFTRKSSSNESTDPFASLGLRLPMPSHIVSSPTQLGVSPSRPTPRARTTSTMYMLGLGSRSTSLTVHSAPSGRISRGKDVTLPDEEPPAGTEAETETEAEDDLQTDVE